MYKNTICHYILISYPTTVQTWSLVLIIFVDSLVYSKYSIMSFPNKFLLFISHLYAFNFFYCLIMLARTSMTMLNRNDEGEHLLPNRRGKAFSQSQLSRMLPVRFSQMPLKKFPSIPSLLSYLS